MPIDITITGATGAQLQKFVDDCAYVHPIPMSEPVLDKDGKVVTPSQPLYTKARWTKQILFNTMKGIMKTAEHRRHNEAEIAQKAVDTEYGDEVV